MDAARIDALMARSVIDGDPDEDRNDRAAPEVESGPGPGTLTRSRGGHYGTPGRRFSI